jgi:hypothetical protein
VSDRLPTKDGSCLCRIRSSPSSYIGVYTCIGISASNVTTFGKQHFDVGPNLTWYLIKIRNRSKEIVFSCSDLTLHIRLSIYTQHTLFITTET